MMSGGATGIVGPNALTSGATFTRNSLANAFVGTTLTPFAVDVPRFGSLTSGGNSGLVVEGSRTNSIRNNTMVGAVVGVIGSGGARPDNWRGVIGAGLSTEIVDFGVVNGMEYIDIRVFGTPSSTTSYQFGFESSTGIVAVNGQTWDVSCFVALVGGDLTNIGFTRLGANENTSTGGFIAGGASSFTPSANPTRIEFVRTLSGGGTVARLDPLVSIGVTSGQDVDVTLRFGLPQAELGAFASSPIKTLGSAAVTRAASVPLIEDVNTKPWFNASEFTVIAEFEIPQFVTSQRIVGLGNAGSLLNRVEIITSGTSARLFAEGGSGTLADFTVAGLVVGALNKVAFRIKLDDYAMSVNGSAVGTDTSSAVPTIADLFIGMSTVSGNHLNGVIKSLTLIPRGLTNAQLQALSS
jgi:hypothetical protein